MEYPMETAIRTQEQPKLLVRAKCAHDGCTCMTTSGEVYCSDYCAEWADAGTHGAAQACNCGHVECAHSAGAHAKRQ